MANIKISELSNAGALNGTEYLPIVQGNATVKTTTQDVVDLLGLNYTPENVANKSTDTTLSANSDTLYPSQKAIKAYVDGTIVSAIKDNGNWDASGNLFPNVNSQGQPITKGDLWYISVGGTLGGTPVLAGYSIRALVNNPAQNASNWGILNVGLGFVPENVANKSTDGTLSANSDTLYPSQKAVRTYVNSISVPTPTLQQVTTAGATTTSNIVVNQVSTSSGASVQSSGRLIAKDIELRPTIGSSTNTVVFDSSLITGNKTYTLPNATGTLALLSSLSATSPISYNSGTGVISMPQANGSQNGFLASSDWTTFNNKLSSATAASTYVPYTGATGNINIGSNQIQGNFSGSVFGLTGNGISFQDIVCTSIVSPNSITSTDNSSGGQAFIGVSSSLPYVGITASSGGGSSLLIDPISGAGILAMSNMLSGVSIQCTNISSSSILELPDISSGTLLATVATSSGSLTTTTSGSVTIPDASASVVGLVNTGSQTFAGSKVFNSGLTSVSNIRGMTAIFVQPSGGNTLTELTYSGTPGSTGSGIMRLHKESGGYAVATKLDANGSSYFNGGNVGIGTTTPNASAILELNSTTQGFLPPRMTQAQRIAIISPATGLMVYQTDSTEGVYVYDSTNTWRRLNWT